MKETVKDWRAIGAQVNDQFVEWAKTEWAPWTYSVKKKRLTSDEDIFFGAIVRAVQGDFGRLISFLESDRQIHLSKEDRDWLARILKHRPWAQKRGRRKTRYAEPLVLLRCFTRNGN